MSEEDNAQAQEMFVLSIPFFTVRGTDQSFSKRILQDYCHLVGICLLYFDHLLTAGKPPIDLHFIETLTQS
jgi:hypothetical protein